MSWTTPLLGRPRCSVREPLDLIDLPRSLRTRARVCAQCARPPRMTCAHAVSLSASSSTSSFRLGSSLAFSTTAGRSRRKKPPLRSGPTQMSPTCLTYAQVYGYACEDEERAPAPRKLPRVTQGLAVNRQRVRYGTFEWLRTRACRAGGAFRLCRRGAKRQRAPGCRRVRAFD